jgi:hypothetical protein
MRTKHLKKGMFLSKYSLERNDVISKMFRTQHTPDLFVAEFYGLRNTTVPLGGLRRRPYYFHSNEIKY